MNFFKPKQSCSSNKQENHHALNNLGTHLFNFLSTNFLNPASSSSSSGKSRCSVPEKALSDEEIKERFTKVPVYSIKDSDDNICALNPMELERGAIFHFFSEQDVDALVRVLDLVEANKQLGFYQTSSVPLAEIFEDGGGVPTRLVPDLSQVKNAVEERKKAGFTDEIFSGVPVFQSDALRMMTNGSTNGPTISRRAFFRKEDLEKAILEEREMNHTGKEREIIQVTALEDIIQEMKDCSTSRWNDVLFIAPGK